MKYGNRSIWKRFISSPLTLLALLILFIILSKAAWGIREKAILSAIRLKTAQTEFGKLQAHQQDLSTQIGYLSTDQGVEAELRTKYRAVKDGESVAVIIDNQTAVATSASTTNMVVEPESWWGRIWHFFGF